MTVFKKSLFFGLFFSLYERSFAHFSPLVFSPPVKKKYSHFLFFSFFSFYYCDMKNTFKPRYKYPDVLDKLFEEQKVIDFVEKLKQELIEVEYIYIQDIYWRAYKELGYNIPNKRWATKLRQKGFLVGIIGERRRNGVLLSPMQKKELGLI